MKQKTAWVITWLHHTAPRMLSGAESGAPLALLPKKSYVEGAMVAAYQMIRDSAPSDAVASLEQPPRDEVEWDAVGENARIGVGLEVWAHHADVEHHLTAAGEGMLSYEHSKWTSPQDLKALARELGDFAAARTAASKRTVTWRPS